ncbi:DUF6710 family protein [Staphylococcus pseudintermedius]|uniref:DUF6710 family protein n=1 Tax=Staphylococcus pseudintermedius TaxID=283734 RepID=UPI003F94FF60
MEYDYQNNLNLMKFIKKNSRRKKILKNQLNNILDKAQYILETNPNRIYEQQHPIFSYIKLFTDLIQSKLATSVMMNGVGNVHIKNGKWFNTVSAYMNPIDNIFLQGKFSESNLYTGVNLKIYNDRDPIVTHVWNSDRLANAIRNIGKGMIDKRYMNIDIKKEHAFKYDELNHKGEYIYPLGITNIYNGNHSISAGLNKSEGNVIIDEIVDISDLYDRYKFDGKYLINRETGKKDQIYFEFGVIFEIGRLLLEHKHIFNKEIQDIIENQKTFEF